MEPETGPPIGEVPIHTHEEPAIAEVVEEVADEADELLDEIRALGTAQETRLSTLTENINTCRTQLERLSQIQPAENPMLTQLLNQMIEIRAELASLKSTLEKQSTDSRVNHPTPKESPAIVVEESVSENEVDHPAVATESSPKRRAIFV